MPTPETFGLQTIESMGAEYVLDLERTDCTLKAWILPLDQWTPGDSIVDDANALDLGVMGDPKDDYDGWYNYDDEEVANMIAEALDMTEAEASLRVDAEEVAANGCVDEAETLESFAVAGLKLALAIAGMSPRTIANDPEIVRRAWEKYKMDTGADLDGKPRSIPYAFERHEKDIESTDESA